MYDRHRMQVLSARKTEKGYFATEVNYSLIKYALVC